MRKFSLSMMFVLVAIAAASARPAGQATEFPRFVVPNVPDLTIKTRHTSNHPNSTIVTEIVSLHGAWQRHEQVFDFPFPTAHRDRRVMITRCDQRQILHLNESTRTYAVLPIENRRRNLGWFRLFTGWRQPEHQAGADVNITIDSVDSGERRQIGRYTARHVITTNTTTPSPGAKTSAGEGVEDGWYIDLPPVDCREQGDQQAILIGSIAPDRVKIQQRRTAKRGFPIEQVSRDGNGDRAFTMSVELIEFSERRVDPSLFAVPQGYRPALPTWAGGYDFTRPDTLPNRAENYWEGLTAWAALSVSILTIPAPYASGR
jgi:hypothetical protein